MNITPVRATLITRNNGTDVLMLYLSAEVSETVCGESYGFFGDLSARIECPKGTGEALLSELALDCEVKRLELE